jgi:hypothetical protein
VTVSRRISAGLITCLFAWCGLLRLWSAGRLGLGQNEAQFLNISAMPDVRAVIAFLYAHESHPPLFYLIAHLLQLVGLPPISAVSGLVLAASVGVVAAAGWVASLSGLRGAGMCAALLVATSVPHIIYSVQLRPYALISLLLLLSLGAMISALRTGRSVWRLAWASALLVLLYLHHLGILIAASQVISLAIYAARRRLGVAHARAWTLACGLVALFVLPDLAMLAHQAGVAGYPAPLGGELVRPMLLFLGLCWRFPAEVLLTAVAALALLWRWCRLASADQIDTCLAMLGLSLSWLLLLLVGVSVRSSFLTVDVALSIAPLGAVAAAVVTTGLLASDRRLAGAIWIEAMVVCTALSALFHMDYAKTNVDLIGDYINAEAMPDDVVLVVPGGIGPALSRTLVRPLSRVDYPFIGPVREYPFDHEFERMSALAPLSAVLDTLEAACMAGRRVWLVTPAPWRLNRTAPSTLTRAEFGASIQPSWARASYLREALLSRFGQPQRTSASDPTARGMEIARWDLFGPTTRVPGEMPPLRCATS